MRLSVLFLAAISLVACSKPAEAPREASGGAAQLVRPSPPALSRADAVAVAAVESTAGASSGQRAPAPTVTVSAPMLAYAYEFGLSAEADPLRALMARHEQACAAAGPTVCQVTGADAEGQDQDVFRATLTLRATPEWVARFRRGLDGELKQAGGRLTRNKTTTEDLTRSIVDTEAAIRAKTTLRDRLQQALASRPGKLSELLELEQELARVQGEIDAAQSELAVMRTRVATSAVTLSYDSAPVFAASGAGAPIGDAVADVVPTLAGTVAVLIRLVTVLTPWVLIVGLVLWLLRKRLPKLGNRKPAASPPPASNEPA